MGIRMLYYPAAVTTAIAGTLHLVLAYNGIARGVSPVTIFFIVSGLAQLFWVVPMIKRWGRIWYYLGIAGNIAFIILYVVTRFPGNPVNGREGDVDVVDMTCEIAQVAYIAITAVILAKERSIKVVDR